MAEPVASTELTLIAHEGEPRIRDVDLGARLGFARVSDIRKLIERHRENLNKISVLATVAQSPAGGGRPSVSYFLNKKQAIFITAKSETPAATDITIEIIEKFDAYERGLISRAPQPDPIALLNDPATMRGLLLTYSEKVLALQGEVAALEPKAAALDRMAESDGSFSLQVSAKLLSVSPKWLLGFMAEHGWIFRRPVTQEWTAYQSRVNSKHLEQRRTTIIQSNGRERTVSQCLVLPRGLALLAEAINRSDPTNAAACDARRIAVSAATSQH